MNHLNILYLTPVNLFKDNHLLMQQWSSLETLIPCFLKSLYEGRVEVKLHEFDKIFSGLRNVENPVETDVLAKTASLWYYFTRITHQSIGPRVGKFAEELIRYWIVSSGLYESVERDVSLSYVLKKYFSLSTNHKNKLDFFVKGRDRALFIELRMSEHTGGRTGQESLMDKFNKILELVASGQLVEQSLTKGLRSIELFIAMLFNENQELINPHAKNYNVGRLNSLINYIMEDNHVWGKVSMIRDKFVLSNNIGLSKDFFENDLKTSREVCLKHREKDFKICLKILLGDEFFKEVLGMCLQDLIKRHGGVIADDLWIMYTLALNELKIANIFKTTSPRRLYEVSKNESELREILEEFRKLYLSCSKANLSSTCSLNEYALRINTLVNEMASRALRVFSRRREELRLLESNDMSVSYIYLRYVCTSVIALYLTIDVMKDHSFSKCRWLSRDESLNS
ncbi:MAG: hypothetical protein QW794_06695 [Thermosphaera sp.]